MIENNWTWLSVDHTAEELKENFWLCRRDGIGASDCAAALKMGHVSKPELIRSKCRTEQTEAEKKVNEVPQVMRGTLKEPETLLWAQTVLGMPVTKPDVMYRDTRYPWLTYNYDGILEQEWFNPETGAAGFGVPDEAKLCTAAGAKNYDFSKAIIGPNKKSAVRSSEGCLQLSDFKACALNEGIPKQYYVQIHQQILGLGTPPYAYLAVFRETKGYNGGLYQDVDYFPGQFYMFMVQTNNLLIEHIIKTTKEVWDEIEQTRNF